jgi:4-hydroxy-4-methyl-2-oxoglutarate aldolase
MAVSDVVSVIGDLSAATLHEAGGKTGALPAAIRPIRLGMRVVGPALPVRGPSGDNLWLHRAIRAAAPGEVLVCDVGSEADFGYWGEVMAVAAQERGIAGLVITGGVRDGDQMAARGFPVFAQSISVLGTRKDPDGAGSVGAPIAIGSVTVHRGDVVVGDNDGVIVLPAGQAAQVAEAGRARDAAEAEIFGRLRAGESTIDIYGLPPEND